MAITPFPGPIPDRDDPDFETRMQDLFTWFTGSLVTELNAQVFTNYQAGGWIPEIADAQTGGVVGSAGTAVGRWVRVGDKVDAWFNLTNIDTTGLAGGNALFIRELPFAIENTTTFLNLPGIVQVRNVTFTTPPQLVGITNAKVMKLSQQVSGANPTDLPVSAFATGTADLFGRLTYRAAT